MDLLKVQGLLQDFGLDGWLFSDYHGHDYISHQFLDLRDRFCTRRMFYFIPASGQPVRLLSAIEPLLLDHLPGEKQLYHGLKGMTAALRELLRPGMKIACQYSPCGNVPTISSMDAGLIEYLRQFGVELVSSADLMQYFGAVLTPEQIESHRQAGICVHRVLDQTFAWIRSNLDAGHAINEWMMLQEMNRLIAQEPIVMDGPPFFGIDDHASDPGYEPKEEGSYPIREGSRLIIDFAARLDREDAIYYDISWCMNIGPKIDPEYQKIFDLVNQVRAAVLDTIQTHLDQGQPIRGCEVDALAQQMIQDAGYGAYLMHRTGHNIGHRCHGVGANLDDYESHDDRCLLPGTMFSVEPGIYTDRIGVRLEYDVHITPEKQLKIYGPIQKEILVI